MKKQSRDNVRNAAILSQLVRALDYSLARYLSYARPWCRHPYLLLGAVTRRLVREHERYAGAIVRLLHARGHSVDSYTFPMEFTYYNDLSLEFLGPKLLDEQQRLIALAKAVATDLAGKDDRQAHWLIEELLASLREYAGILKELLGPHRLAPPTPRDVAAASDKAPSGSLQRPKRTKAVGAETQTAA